MATAGRFSLWTGPRDHTLVHRLMPWVESVVVMLGLAFSQVAPAAEGQQSPTSTTAPVAGSRSAAPIGARAFAAWVIRANDHDGAPFLVIDKVNAMAFAYSPEGELLASSPVLLGLARGDVSPADIGSRPLSKIGPADRITPAGRFEAAQGINLDGKSVLWIDYDAALSLHPVITATPSDRRRKRLASVTASDNRISFGCINVPPAFYAGVVGPLFSTNIGIVYILPDTRSIEDVFVGRAPPPY